ncbi:MAG: flagellar basal body protein [Oscillospiraceae bacterium]|nr:flagellar basal body protein [Oscillospiraceae bacterium]
MASSFFGIHVARGALQLAQKSIDITLNNVANISTPGYSRQRLDVCSVGTHNNIKGYNSENLAGMGAEAVGVTQIRDKLLDTKIRNYCADLCSIGARTSVLGELEDILDEVENEEQGFGAKLGDLKAAFQSFSAESADRKDLANIAQKKGQSVANVLQNFDMRIDEVMAGTARDIESTNDKVNSILKQMGDLNAQIKDGYVNMHDIIIEPGDDSYRADVTYGPLVLKDTFNRLADELSQYMNVYVEEQKDGTYTVSCHNVTLVQEDKYAKVDMKFNPKTDVVKDADGNVLNAKFLEFPIEEALYDRNGKQFLDADGEKITDVRSTDIPQGTELYFANGTFTGLYSDGKGGFYDGNGDRVDKVFSLDDTKYYYADDDGNILKDQFGNDWEVTDLDSVYQGMKVVARPEKGDGEPYVIDVKGHLDGRCIEEDFAEAYVSSLNTTSQWKKTEREAYPQLLSVIAKGIQVKADEDQGKQIDDKTAMKMAEDTIRDFNQLIRDCEVEEAYNMEKDILEYVDLGKAHLDWAEADKTYYDPIFKDNIRAQAMAMGKDLATLKMPAYAITISEESGTITSGSIKGLFDMYNGEGGYSVPEGNNYPGVKYFKETIRALSKAIVSQFNSVYNDYNNQITLEKYKLENGIAADAQLTAAQQKDYENQKEDLIDKYGFEMFEFDGAMTTANLKVAESWVANALRCVHPEGTNDEDYNYDQLDGSKLNDILEVFTRKINFPSVKDPYSLEGFVENYGETIGTKLEHELGDFENASKMYEGIDEERESIMGVDMNEEGANMMTYQKWYNAISRMMTALDEMLDKLINGTGRVGL